MTTCELTRADAITRGPRLPRVRRGRGRLGGWAGELALLSVLYLAYSAARLVGGATTGEAFGHAGDLLALERSLHLAVEARANAALQAVPALAVAASYWYSLLHYVVTPAVLVWAYRRHRPYYGRVRNALVAASALGLVGFTLVPMAPPRMLPGYVDTLASTAHLGWWGAQASAPRGLGGLTNQLAAMPSLHVGWAVWVTWVVLRLARRRWVRLAALAYPLVTTAVVVGTANHYLLDAVAGAAVVGAGIVLARRWSPGPTGTATPARTGVDRESLPRAA